MSVRMLQSSVLHRSPDGRAKQRCPSHVIPRALNGACSHQIYSQKCYCTHERRLCRAALPESSTADSNSDLYSLGVQLKPYSDKDALKAVSNKSFACTMCGKCCSMAEDSEVWLSDREASALADHLNISAATFTALYCQPYDKVPGWKLLLNKQQQQQQQQGAQATATAAGLPGQPAAAVCVFFDEITKGCTVYPVRPIQCSTYPWWPELMPDKHWRLEKEYICEGFEHPDAGPMDYPAAAQQLQKATQHTMALEAAKPAGWDAGQQLYGETHPQTR